MLRHKFVVAVFYNYFGETNDKNCGNCDVCHTPPQMFDGTIIAQKAMSAIMRTNESVGFTVTIDILRGNMSAEVVSHNYNQLKTFAAGRDIPFRDWHDYLLQLLQMGFIEIAYNENHHIHVTDLGKEVLYGKRIVHLATINREDFSVKARRRKIQEEQRIDPVVVQRDENKELFEKLRQVRKRIAEENHWPAYVVMSDRSLHALATERPTTLHAFGNTFGIGEHKRDTYGQDFIAVIREYVVDKEELPFPETAIESAPKSKSISYMDQQKQLHAKAYAPWTEEDDKILASHCNQGLSVEDIAKRMDRNEGGIMSRIKKLGIERPKATAYHIFPKQVSGLSKTAHKTLEQLAAGLNPPLIEKKRKLSESIIYDHIAELIEKGILIASDFVSQEAYNKITKAIEQVPSEKLSEIKALCGDDISYIDIKLVIADLRRMNHDLKCQNIPYTKSSKSILTCNCCIVLSKSGYFLKLKESFIKLRNIADGFSYDKGNIHIKKPNNELGYRIYHDTEDDIRLIGYIREEKAHVIFTSPDNQTIVINETNL